MIFRELHDPVYAILLCFTMRETESVGSSFIEIGNDFHASLEDKRQPFS